VLQRQHRDDAIEVHAIRFADGEIFAGFEFLAAEMVAGFIRGVAGDVVVETPAPAWTVNEMTEIIFAVGALADDAAGVLMLSPSFRVDPRFRVKGRNENIGSLAVAFGMIVIACAFEADIAKFAGQRRVAE